MKNGGKRRRPRRQTPKPPVAPAFSMANNPHIIHSIIIFAPWGPKRHSFLPWPTQLPNHPNEQHSRAVGPAGGTLENGLLLACIAHILSIVCYFYFILFTCVWDNGQHQHNKEALKGICNLVDAAMAIFLFCQSKEEAILLPIPILLSLIPIPPQ
jgi:hypothetical protein